jgi:hypothetical protein
MNVAIDLTHSDYWYTDITTTEASELGSDLNDLAYMGHWATLAGLSGATGQTEAVGEPSVLLVALPMTRAEAEFTKIETEGITAHLNCGGGVLLFGRGIHTAGGVEIDLPGLLRLRLGGRIHGSAAPQLPHVLADDFDISVNGTHAVLDGVDFVHLYQPRRVECEPIDLEPVIESDGGGVIHCGSVGAGRVAIVSNAEMFSLPFIGRHDNARLLANLLGWLDLGDDTANTRGTARAARGASFMVSGFRGGSRRLPEPGDLADRPGNHLVDVTAHRPELEQIAVATTPDPYLDLDLFLYDAELRYANVPSSVRRAVSEFRRESNDYGVLLIRGLPTETLPPTPSDPSSVAIKDSWQSEFWLATFAQALGAPFAYAQEKQGALFQNVVPTPHNADKLSSESSTILLDYHTETAFHPFKPDFVLLHCLRPDHDRTARTISASARMILPLLTPKERALLAQPLFQTGIDYSFGSANGLQGNGPVLAVLTGNPADPELTYDLDLMVGTTKEAKHALQALRLAAAEVGCWVQLDQGDLLIVDNRRAVHARSEFIPRYDGRDRWLQRTCVTVDFARSSAYRRAGSHIIETSFSL